MSKTETLRIRVTPELKATFECLAKQDGRTPSDYARRVLEQHARSVECFEELVSSTESSNKKGVTK